MVELLAVAFLGGLITGISPCIVPVLPVVVAGGSTGTSRSRPFLIIAGLVVSFSVTELIGSTVLSAIGLPQNLLFWLGVALLLVLAVGLMIPLIGERLERPFARLGTSRYATWGGGFVLGLSLGLVFVPCAGPVLAAISVAAANHRVTASSFFVTLAYAVGAALPLLIFALIAQRAVTGWQKLRTHLPAVRRVAGAVLAVTTLAIAFGLFDPLQRSVPGYTSALENNIESSSSIAKQLQNLSGEHANTFAAKQAKTATQKTSSLPNLGKAPNFTGIVAWLNTPGNKPLSLSQLRGKVVLVDFWTYSCINCQRSLPHVEAWNSAYNKDGLVVVGVSTPEFAFEHVVSNVASAAGSLRVNYPIAIDNNYGTWNAYNNEYWPAEYLIDPTGHVRAYDFGEGGYSTMESNIRSLLTANGVAHLPVRTDVANKTPTAQTTQESYLGYSQLQFAVGTAAVHDKAADYQAPTTIPANTLAFNGTWTVHKEEATAGDGAQIRLQFTADDVYLVMSGHGTVGVSFNGQPLPTVSVSGIPKLYTLYSGGSLQTGELTLSFSPGIQAYDFTFG
ncbi:MAG TPA: cytochrome c biogenesis protein DipZ [Acidimicrobiales bacterium]|nr:cytochrome c biogenesis protein DipZ [Acidimicrobiales bacterium]